MATSFSSVFSSDDTQANQPDDPNVPEPVVYDNPDSPDDRGPGEPAQDFSSSQDTGGGDDFGGF